MVTNDNEDMDFTFEYSIMLGTGTYAYKKKTGKNRFRLSDLYSGYFVTVGSLLEVSQQQQISTIYNLLSDM